MTPLLATFAVVSLPLVVRPVSVVPTSDRMGGR